MELPPQGPDLLFHLPSSSSTQLQPLFPDLTSHLPSSWSTPWVPDLHLQSPVLQSTVFPPVVSAASPTCHVSPTPGPLYALPPPVPPTQSLTEPDTPSCHCRFFCLMSSSEPSLQSHSFYLCMPSPCLTFLTNYIICVQTFSVKSQRMNILAFRGHTATTQYRLQYRKRNTTCKGHM